MPQLLLLLVKLLKDLALVYLTTNIAGSIRVDPPADGVPLGYSGSNKKAGEDDGEQIV